MTLVDVDAHPVVMPPDLTQMASRSGGRVTWSATVSARRSSVTFIRGRATTGCVPTPGRSTGFPGSDYELLREQLLDEHEIDFCILLCLNGFDSGYERAEFDAAINRGINDCMAADWLERDERLRSAILRADRAP